MLKQLLKKTFVYSVYKKHLHRKTIRKDNRIKKYFQINGMKDILYLQEKLTFLELPFFFDFGTLLGLYRDGQIIKGDMDIDIGVLVDEKNTVYNIEKKLSCFKKIRSFSSDVSGVAEQSFELNKYARFDIHYYYMDNNTRYCCLFYRLPEDSLSNDCFNTVKVILDNFSIGKYELKGKQLSVPVPTEEFLIQKYGKTWRIPDSNWNYWEGPSSVKVLEKGHIDLFIK